MAVMNPEIKALWVKSLRDNVDRQGVGALNDTTNGTFCCLGELCELAFVAGVVDFHDAGRDSAYGPPDPFLRENAILLGYGDWSSATLPRTVSEWAGLDTDNPSVMATPPEGGEPRLCALTELNDEWQLDFLQIADLIEQQL